MNIKALMYSFRMISIPTISVAILLFFWFMDFAVLGHFFLSKEIFPSFLRVALFLLEVALVVYFYKEKVKEVSVKELYNQDSIQYTGEYLNNKFDYRKKNYIVRENDDFILIEKPKS